MKQTAQIKPKCLITGSHGFIGQNLKEYLNPTYEILGVDRFTLADPMKLQEQVNAFQPDYIIHTAAYGNHAGQEDEYEIIAANIVLLHFILEATKPLNYKAFINCSTSSVYGTKAEPMKENDLPETDTMYGATKLAGEYICKYFAKRWDKPIVSARLFSIYGKGEAPHRFIPRIMDSIENDRPIQLDPSPKHDWVYVDDVAESFLTLFNNIDKVKGQAVNICTGTQWSNEELVGRIEWIMNKCSRVQLVPKMRSFDTVNWVGDNSKLKELGFIPQYDLMKGLRKVVNVYAKQAA